MWMPALARILASVHVLALVLLLSRMLLSLVLLAQLLLVCVLLASVLVPAPALLFLVGRRVLALVRRQS